MSDIPRCEYPAMAPPVEVLLAESSDHPCNYLPGRTARTRAFATRRMPGELYHQFMDAGFRRSGLVVYQPICPGCRQCLPIRVPVQTFRPDKSQRRCQRRNADLNITLNVPAATDEKYELYRRYMVEWHHADLDPPREEFESFLYESPVDSLEFCYRDSAGKLLAVGICDICPSSLSSVYFYHDPSERRRALGVYGVLREIDFALHNGIPYYYLGYWVNGCRTMSYKADYLPHEILHPDGIWRSVAVQTESETGQTGPVFPLLPGPEDSE